MAIVGAPRSDYCERNHQILGDAFGQQHYSISHCFPAVSDEFYKDVRAFVEKYYHMLSHSPAEAAKFYDDASLFCRHEYDGSMSVTKTLIDIYHKILSLKYDKFVGINIISLDVGLSINYKVAVTVNGCLTRKNYKTQRFFHTFLLARVPLGGGFYVLRDTFTYVDELLYADFMHFDDGNELSATDMDEIYYSGVTLSHLEKVYNKFPRQLAEESANGEVSVVKEEEQPEAEVLDQVQDNPHPVVQTAGKIEEIVSDRASASASLSSRNEFQEDRRKVAKKMELQQLYHGVAEEIDEVKDDSQIVQPSAVKIEKVPKKSSASIQDRGRPSASSTSHSSRSEFQDGESAHADPHGSKVAMKMEFQSPAIYDLQRRVLDEAVQLQKWRQIARENWDLSKTYKNQANTPHTKRKRPDINSLREQAISAAEKAEKEVIKACQFIFSARSSMISDNTLQIDLHYLPVEHAMWYLKCHLEFFSSIRFVLILKVITGQGIHSEGGEPQIKTAVTIFLNDKKIEWAEEERNPGALLIRLDGKREFKFGPG